MFKIQSLAEMMCEGKCTNCHQFKTLNVFKKLCENCLKLQTARVPFKRKRYESEISAKSGISALSVDTQLTDIYDDDDLECDGGPSSDDNDTRELTNPKTIEFGLQDVGSLYSQRYYNPPEKIGQPNTRPCTSRTSLSSASKAAALNRQPQAQAKRRRQMKKNYSESDSGGFKQRPYTTNRRYSADDENLIEELVPYHESIVGLNENVDTPPRVYVARSARTFHRSDPNLHRINSNLENLMPINPDNLYDSIKDNDSGYMQHQFVGQQRRQRAPGDRLDPLNQEKEEYQTYCDKCLQGPARFKWTIVMIVIAWIPVGVLSALLLMSVHDEPPSPTEQPLLLMVILVSFRYK